MRIAAAEEYAGIGEPAPTPWTGGVLQYINQYDGALPGYLARAERPLPPPALLRHKAARPSTRYDRPLHSGLNLDHGKVVVS
jgi:hypothetical protein